MPNYQEKAITLGWLDPRTNKINQAGVAFFNQTYGEYLMKIDEEAKEKQYYLKPFAAEKGQIVYRMELVIKDRFGKFLRRQTVGEGHSSSEPNSTVYVDYGSKFKALVLLRKEEAYEK